MTEQKEEISKFICLDCTLPIGLVEIPQNNAYINIYDETGKLVDVKVNFNASGKCSVCNQVWTLRELLHDRV